MSDDEKPTIKADVNIESSDKNGSKDMHPLLKYVGLPVATLAMAGLAFQYFMDADRDNRVFERTVLVDKLDKFTIAATKADESNKQMIAKAERMSEELDDQTKVMNALLNRIDILMSRLWQESRDEEGAP